MEEIILLKLGEIVLKGLNRISFERKLMANIARRLKDFGEFDIYSMQSTIYVEPKTQNCDMEKSLDAVKKIFGIVAVSRAAVCAKDKDEIAETAKSYLGARLSSEKTFKVESKRADKKFPMTSMELSKYVGGILHGAFENLEVDVKNPDVLVNIEVREKAAYVHAEAEPGAGGMPVGVNGRAVALLSGGIDSPVAAYMIAKRGVAVTMLHFFSYPYTSERAKEKVLTLAKTLTGYCGRVEVLIAPFTRIQEEISRNCPEEYYTVIMRRFMMRIAERAAKSVGARSIVTGESLGQVASQTMEAMGVTGSVCTLPVFRPVIGMDKEEIVQLARKIGTFKTSILPYEDCCTVFTPKHPKTKPKQSEAEAAEQALDIEGLINESLQNIETVVIDL